MCVYVCLCIRMRHRAYTLYNIETYYTYDYNIYIILLYDYEYESMNVQ